MFMMIIYVIFIIFAILVILAGKFRMKTSKDAIRNYLIGGIILVLSLLLLINKTNSINRENNRIKIGMSQSEVKERIGKIDYKNKNLIQTKKHSYYFKDDKLIGGDTKDLVNQVKKNGKDNRDNKTAFAQSFGRKPTDSIAKNPTAYKTTTSGDTTKYSWNSGYGLMIRVDSPDRTTKVYMADDSKDNGLGELLYTGRTIYQKATHVIY